jgi:hypothetical protein
MQVGEMFSEADCGLEFWALDSAAIWRHMSKTGPKTLKMTNIGPFSFYNTKYRTLKKSDLLLYTKPIEN